MLLIRESDPIEHKGFYFPTYFSKSCIHLLFAEGEDDDLVANDCRAKVQAILGNTRHMRDHEEGRWWLALSECPHLLINSGDGFERRPTGKLKTVELFLDVIEAPPPRDPSDPVSVGAVRIDVYLFFCVARCDWMLLTDAWWCCRCHLVGRRSRRPAVYIEP